ncbi:MAG: (Fe-S)-binding protein [Promethearchaeia archaeon]
MEKKESRIEGRENYPTKEVDPEHFLDDEEVKEKMENLGEIEFEKDDFYAVYNCVDCGECETERERIQLKQKYLEQGYTFEGWKDMRDYFQKYRTPYPTNEMRIRIPDGIPEESDTLFFMGCLSTIRIPRYTEHALQYLLAQEVDFTILDKEICCGWPWYVSGSTRELNICMEENIDIFKAYDRIICLCPACYHLFRNDYAKKMDNEIEFEYITKYLRPATEKKWGSVAFQHLCQLKNRGRENVDKKVEKIFQDSGYDVIDVPHWCCGGGIGYMHRTDIIEEIAKKRMEDFNKEEIDYVTSYCVSCWWVLSRLGRKTHIKPKFKDIFELLL